MLIDYNIKKMLHETANEAFNKKEILFKYTQELDFTVSLSSIKNLSEIFYISYPDKRTYISFGKCKEYILKSKTDLNKLKTLSYTVKSFGNLYTNEKLKLFGGINFNIDGKHKYPWEDIPKGLFFIPKFLISKVKNKFYLTFFNIVTSDSNINEIQYQYKSFINEIKIKHKRKSSSLIFDKDIPNRIEYSKLFKSYIKKIKEKKIDKSILARIKKFSSNNKLFLQDSKSKCTNFYIDFTRNKHFIGSTPELLIQVNNLNFKSCALAGTYKKNNQNNNLDIVSKFLKNKKELSEHKYVIDYLKNNLKKHTTNFLLNDTPAILELEHILHLHTPIKGKLKKDSHILDIVLDLHPTPAILGTPTDKAKKIILDNEPFERGWYSGCIGWFDINGDGRFDVSIRSALQTDNTVFFYAGGGIISDSIEKKEWEETEIKFQHLLSLIR